MQELKQGESLVGDQIAQCSGRIYYGWVIVCVCFIVLALNAPLLASFSMFYKPVLDEFHWTRGSTAIAMAIHLVVSGLAGPVAGALIDRYQARRVMPIGAIIMGGALLWLSQASALWHFYAAFGVVAAAGSGLIHITPLTRIVSNWFMLHRGTAIGALAAGSGAGQLVLLPLLQYLINRIGWRNSYIVLGCLILVVPTVLILAFLHNRPEDRGLSAEAEMQPRRKRQPVNIVVEEGGRVIERKTGFVRKNEVVILDQEWAETDWTVGKAVNTFRFWALTLMVAMFSAGFFIISVQLVVYLTDAGYSSLLAASVMGFQGFINMGGKFFGGVLCDRIGREKTLTLSIAVFVACIILLAIGGVVISPVLIYVFAIFYGLGYGMALPALITSSSDLFQGKHFGAILGVILLGGFFGGAIGTWLGGYLYDLTSAYRMNFLVAVLTMAVSGVLVWKARPSRVRLMRSIQVDSI
jgi:MFS family permease